MFTAITANTADATAVTVKSKQTTIKKKKRKKVQSRKYFSGWRGQKARRGDLKALENFL